MVETTTAVIKNAGAKTEKRDANDENQRLLRLEEQQRTIIAKLNFIGDEVTKLTAGLDSVIQAAEASKREMAEQFRALSELIRQSRVQQPPADRSPTFSSGVAQVGSQNSEEASPPAGSSVLRGKKAVGSDLVQATAPHQTNQSSVSGSKMPKNGSLYSVDFQRLDGVVKLEHPLNTPMCGTEILGCCNGLLALYNDEEEIVIWNPTTREYRRLPEIEIEFHPRSFCCQFIVYGFGYDSVHDDYKLARLVQFFGDDDDPFFSEVKVYSLREHSWHRIMDFPYYLRYKRCHGILLNNALHWVVNSSWESTDADSIVALDLCTEDYRVIEQPNYGKMKCHLNVQELGGCLAITANYLRKRVDLWVMKEYGVKESWTKLLTVRHTDNEPSFEFVIPVAYVGDGSKLLLVQDSNKFICYDLRSKKVEEVRVKGLSNYFEVAVLAGTLVKVGGSCGGPSKKRREQKKKKKNKNSGVNLLEVDPL